MLWTEKKILQSKLEKNELETCDQTDLNSIPDSEPGFKSLAKLANRPLYPTKELEIYFTREPTSLYFQDCLFFKDFNRTYAVKQQLLNTVPHVAYMRVENQTGQDSSMHRPVDRGLLQIPSSVGHLDAMRSLINILAIDRLLYQPDLE
ncbi:hypothetical protein llap_19821 [Limosa lapponica baueri]|uniref:Uncharacterized protein n=1 Tax=Limosa lapponica baueri TaxID=1758121 RepID=A0A2I0T7T6_LIMLA|nr:hypothetical protein llap_19821 [Limosa lapponica baueri]